MFWLKETLAHLFSLLFTLFPPSPRVDKLPYLFTVRAIIFEVNLRVRDISWQLFLPFFLPLSPWVATDK